MYSSLILSLVNCLCIKKEYKETVCYTPCRDIKNKNTKINNCSSTFSFDKFHLYKIHRKKFYLKVTLILIKDVLNRTLTIPFLSVFLQTIYIITFFRKSYYSSLLLINFIYLQVTLYIKEFS